MSGRLLGCCKASTLLSNQPQGCPGTNNSKRTFLLGCLLQLGEFKTFQLFLILPYTVLSLLLICIHHCQRGPRQLDGRTEGPQFKSTFYTPVLGQSDRLVWQQTQKQAFGARLLAVGDLFGSSVTEYT